MLALYHICFALVLAFAGPFILLFKKKARAGVGQKLGRIPAALKKDQKQGGIWIHAVSVGEFNAVRPLLERLHKELNALPIYVSTTTATAQALAQERVGDFATVFYFPYDLPFATKSWLDHLRPRLVVIAETEIWPGFINSCDKRNIAIVTVNGRMSPKSANNYYRMRAFFGPVLRQLTRIGAQSDAEKERYCSVGGDELPVVVTGNIKLDGLSTICDTAIEKLRLQLAIETNDFVVVAGSTHEGEETAVIDAYEILIEQMEKNNADRPRLIIAPRHPERFQRVAALIAQRGFAVRRYSARDNFTSDSTGQPREIYLLDGLGQLTNYYSLASIAFVGGTLVPVGGHNLLEPYAYSVPTCCGPHTHKTRDVAKALNELSAMIQVRDSRELSEKLAHYHLNRKACQALGKLGRDYIDRNQGATERTFQLLKEVLSATESGGAPRKEMSVSR